MSANPSGPGLGLTDSALKCARFELGERAADGDRKIQGHESEVIGSNLGDYGKARLTNAGKASGHMMRADSPFGSRRSLVVEIVAKWSDFVSTTNLPSVDV